MKTRVLSLLITLAMVMSMASFAAVTAFAETVTADYVDADGNIQTATEVTEITDGGSYPSGWYILRGSRSLGRINFAANGDVHLIIENGADVTLNGGILLGEASTSLTIYCQPTNAGDNEGRITATGTECGAGIGSGKEGSCGDITLNGGIITATVGNDGAGIGSGCKGSCGDIIVNGGTITAKVDNGGAGVGSGFNGNCGDIILNGGTVMATGGFVGAGIGSGGCPKGSCNSITVNGGTVIAKGGANGAGIGSGGSGGSCGNISLKGGTITANGGDNSLFTDFDTESHYHGEDIVENGGNSPGIGSGTGGHCGNITLEGGTITANGSGNCPGIGSGYLGGSCGRITISGTPTIKAGNDADSAQIVSEYNGQRYVNVTYLQNGNLINPGAEHDSENPATGYTNNGTFWIALMLTFAFGLALYGAKKVRKVH